jgi:hypothetical protein
MVSQRKNELVSQHDSTTVMFTFDDLRRDSRKHAHSTGLLPYWWYVTSTMTLFYLTQTTMGQTQHSSLTWLLTIMPTLKKRKTRKQMDKKQVGQQPHDIQVVYYKVTSFIFLLPMDWSSNAEISTIYQ